MTLDELKTLREGEVVVLTKVDEKIIDYHYYKIGDELVFYRFNDDISSVDFVRTSGEYASVTHFSYEFCHYIERKIELERNNKLNSLGI
jgi:hypothetical protein